MQIRGVDFTSAPSRSKPLTLAIGHLDGDVLRITEVQRHGTFAPFEAALAEAGPWVMGIDAPFCFAAPFLKRMGWPSDWAALAAHLGTMDKADYLAAITEDRAAHPAGSKHVPRGLDRLTGGAPPNNIVNPPVGRMVFELLPRLHRAGVAIPGLASGDIQRSVVEAYPAVLARSCLGTTAYKDGPPEDQGRRRGLRRTLLDRLGVKNLYGVGLVAPVDCADDVKGDDLDAVLCAVQAAWAYRTGLAQPTGPNGLRPSAAHPVEGWIADPSAFDPPWATHPTPPTDP